MKCGHGKVDENGQWNERLADWMGKSILIHQIEMKLPSLPAILDHFSRSGYVDYGPPATELATT